MFFRFTTTNVANYFRMSKKVGKIDGIEWQRMTLNGSRSQCSLNGKLTNCYYMPFSTQRVRMPLRA